MQIRLDHHSGEPIYRQIVEQVKYRVACGSLGEGDPLPSIRTLANELKVNPQTVVKAYETLRTAGLVVMQHGRGVFVSTNRGSIPATTRRGEIQRLAKRLLAEGSRMGAQPSEVLEILRHEAEKMEAKK